MKTAQEILKEILGYEIEESFLDPNNATRKKIFDKVNENINTIDYIITSSGAIVDWVIDNESIKPNSTIARKIEEDNKTNNNKTKTQITDLKSNIVLNKLVLIFLFLLKKYGQENIIKSLKNTSTNIEEAITGRNLTNYSPVNLEIQMSLLVIDTYVNSFIYDIFDYKEDNAKLNLDNSEIDTALTFMDKKKENSIVIGYILSHLLSLIEKLFNEDPSKLKDIINECARAIDLKYNNIPKIAAILNEQLVKKLNLNKVIAYNINILFMIFSTLVLKSEIILDEVKKYAVFSYLIKE